MQHEYITVAGTNYRSALKHFILYTCKLVGAKLRRKNFKCCLGLGFVHTKSVIRYIDKTLSKLIKATYLWIQWTVNSTLANDFSSVWLVRRVMQKKKGQKVKPCTSSILMTCAVSNINNEYSFLCKEFVYDLRYYKYFELSIYSNPWLAHYARSKYPLTVLAQTVRAFHVEPG